MRLLDEATSDQLQGLGGGSIADETWLLLNVFVYAIARRRDNCVYNLSGYAGSGLSLCVHAITR